MVSNDVKKSAEGLENDRLDLGVVKCLLENVFQGLQKAVTLRSFFEDLEGSIVTSSGSRLSCRFRGIQEHFQGSNKVVFKNLKVFRISLNFFNLLFFSELEIWFIGSR